MSQTSPDDSPKSSRPSDAPTPVSSASSGTVPTEPQRVPKAAWYFRPLFWSLLLGLALILYGGWLIRLQWQARAAVKAAQEQELQDLAQHNAALDAEAKRLRDALAGDPCAARDLLLTWPMPSATPGSGANLSASPSPTPSAKQPANPSANSPANPVKDPAVKATDAIPGNPPATAPENMQKADAPNAEKPNRSTPAPAPESPKTMASLLEQATVLILSEVSDGTNTGSGFFIAPGLIFTNRHVVEDGTELIYVVGKFPGGVAKAVPLAVSSTEGRDYAVLKVSVTSAPSLSISQDVSRTQRVSAWGFPDAVTSDDPKFQALLEGKKSETPEVVYSEGVVSAVLDRKPPLIVHTAVVSPGNSGGPLVNDKGEVVGVNTYIRLDDASYRQSSLAIVSKDIVNFLAEHNIPFTLSAAAAPGKE